MSFLEKLEESVRRNDSLLCVGLDPDPEKFPPHLHRESDSVSAFLGRIIEATSDLVAAYKPNFACFGALGGRGWSLLETVLDQIPSSLPASLRRGSEWRLDPENGRIFSTYYGKRYQLPIARSDRERAERWAEERRVRKASGDPETRKAMPGNGASQHER